MPPAVSTHRQFVLPDLGEGLTEAELVAWHVDVGDVVTLNQVLGEVETEKAVVELPSPFAGTVVELLVSAGETVRVGAPLITIDSAAAPTANTKIETTTDPAADAEEKVEMLVGYGPSDAPPSRRRRNGSGHRERTTAAPDRPPSPPSAPSPPSSPSPPAKPLAAPPVRLMARQNGVDLADVAGHGPDGIITREDLAAHIADAEARQRGPERESARHERPYAA